jgi:hypothetical protein
VAADRENSHRKRHTENTEKSDNNSIYAPSQGSEIKQERQAHTGCSQAMDLNAAPIIAPDKSSYGSTRHQKNWRRIEPNNSVFFVSFSVAVHLKVLPV